MLDQKTVLITGASSGIGLATAIFLAQKGFRVWAGIRDISKKEALEKKAKEENLPLEFIFLDVLKKESVESTLEKISKESGRLDVLVNNAGYCLLGFCEHYSQEQIHHQFETNFFAPLMLIKAVLPFMRRQKSGRIINISSIYAELPFPMTSVYSATKFGLEAVTAALRFELAPFGIQVATIQPGSVKTNFKNSSVFCEELHGQDSPYYQSAKSYIEKMRSAKISGIAPELVAKTVYSAIASPNMKRRYLVGLDANFLFLIKVLFPYWLAEKIFIYLFSFPKKNE